MAERGAGETAFFSKKAVSPAKYSGLRKYFGLSFSEREREGKALFSKRVSPRENIGYARAAIAHAQGSPDAPQKDDQRFALLIAQGVYPADKFFLVLSAVLFVPVVFREKFGKRYPERLAYRAQRG